MDATQISELRAWAGRLEERTSSDELRAAGKAIAMLVDEVEALQAKLKLARPAPPVRAAAAAEPQPEPEPATEPAETADEAPWAAADDRLSGSFRSRLKRTFGLDE